MVANDGVQRAGGALISAPHLPASRYILRLQYLRRIAALEKEREVSNVRSRIARDIHDDLGSGLTRITMLSREMQGTTGANKDKGKLAAHIASASSQLIGQLGEIVWAVDPRERPRGRARSLLMCVQPVRQAVRRTQHRPAHGLDGGSRARTA